MKAQRTLSVQLDSKVLYSLSLALVLISENEDPVGSQLKSDWIGRKVWVNGSIAYADKGNLAAWDMLEPAVIVGIRQEITPEAQEITGPPIWNVFFGSGPTERRGARRLVVRLSLPKSAKLVTSDETNPTRSVTHKLLTTEAKRKRQTSAWLYAQDLNHFLMQVSAAPSWQDLAGESQPIQKAFKMREIEPGMSRKLVVRLLGYPNYLKSSSSQHFEKTWTWPAHTMDNYDVSFGLDGRVEGAGINWFKLP